MLQTSVVRLHFLTPRLRAVARAREVGADSQVQCYLEALEALLDREFDDRGGRYHCQPASMPLGRDQEVSVHSRRSDTSRMFMRISTAVLKRVPRFGRVQRVIVSTVKQQQRSRTSTSDERGLSDKVIL
jgi:hypothetical protein